MAETGQLFGNNSNQFNNYLSSGMIPVIINANTVYD